MLRITNNTKSIKSNIKSRLSEEDTYKLLFKAQNGDKKAEQKLVLHNIGYVTYICNRYCKHLDTISFEDKVSAGILGLYRSITKYDFNKGLGFNAYAKLWIIEFVRKEAHAGIQYFTSKEGGSHRKMAKFKSLNVTANSVHHGNPDDADWIDVLKDDEALLPEQEYSIKLDKYIARKAVSMLRLSSQKEVISNYYLSDEGLSFADLAKSRGVTRQRVKQIENMAFKNLREIINNNSMYTKDDF